MGAVQGNGNTRCLGVAACRHELERNVAPARQCGDPEEHKERIPDVWSDARDAGNVGQHTTYNRIEISSNRIEITSNRIEISSNASEAEGAAAKDRRTVKADVGVVHPVSTLGDALVLVKRNVKVTRLQLALEQRHAQNGEDEPEDGHQHRDVPDAGQREHKRPYDNLAHTEL